ncbi:hypothetical protein DVH05_007382 [Phytophthora capsici]|nr:hypothetical protein DVH05_007382 [Phytophthora capsici]
MKAEDSDEERLTRVDLATGTVIVGNVRVTDWMEEMMADAEEYDAELAAVRLATVHPAMTSRRFSREEREEREEAQRQRSAKLEQRVRELARSGEGAQQLATGGVGADGGSSRTTPANDEVVQAISEDGEAAEPDSIGEEAELDVVADSESPDTGSEDGPEKQLQQARRRRRRKNRMRKRKRVLLARSKLDRVNDVLKRTLDETREAVREKHATEALEQLRQRQDRRKCGDNPGTETELARVRLVQRHGEPGEGDAVQYVDAEDGLPTACVMIEGEQKFIKLDSCARYSVAGTAWMQYGNKLPRDAPVEYVEGIGGFLLDVLGVWRFQFQNVFGDTICVDACVISGCTEEFLLGVDFLTDKKANMDFERNEVKYGENGRTIVIPFRTNDADAGRTTAPARMAGKAQIPANAVTPIEIAVAAKDGERGLFIPTLTTGTVLLAATVTTARNGRAWVPAINANGTPARLPNKKELGTWLPVDEDMEILDVNQNVDPGRMDKWLNNLGDDETPLENEEEVQIGVEEPEARELVKRLLRVYRKLTSNNSDCPPATFSTILTLETQPRS